MLDVATKFEEIRSIKLVAIWTSGNITAINLSATIETHIACVSVVIPKLCHSIN